MTEEDRANTQTPAPTMPGVEPEVALRQADGMASALRRLTQGKARRPHGIKPPAPGEAKRNDHEPRRKRPDDVDVEIVSKF